jgi:hypothetical protein
MASSSESVGMAYDSITNQIYPSPGYVNGIGTLAQFNTPSGLAISSLTPPSPPSAPAAATGSQQYALVVIVGIIVFVKLSSQHLRFNHLLGLVVKVDNTDLLMEWNWY